jgi:hypothetical protein
MSGAYSLQMLEAPQVGERMSGGVFQTSGVGLRHSVLQDWVGNGA